MSDQLTKLDTYEEFIPKLKKCMENIGDEVLPVAYTDIKHFKYFNDTYGYQLGNDLLVRLAEMISEEREIFLCGARVVSDNIVSAGYLRGCDEKQILKFLRTSTEKIELELRKEFNCNRIRLTTGVFFVTKDNCHLDPETIVSNANLARKQAKERGVDEIVVFEEKMAKRINKEVEILSSIEDALEKREIKAYYQPKIDSRNGKLIGAEALVRWQKHNGEWMYPDEFIPVLEKSGQIVKVDYFMYEEVFAYVRRRIDQRKAVVPISMNVSRVHLRDLTIADYVSSLFEKYRIPPEFVEFEITENVFIENTETVKSFVEAFHSMGVKVSMDDFGSGYSSLNLLSQIPIDVIKLDKCFLRSMCMSEKEKVVVSSIVNMTKALGMDSLCEGVESDEQSKFLKSIGCDIQQGYYFSKPVAEDAFDKLL